VLHALHLGLKLREPALHLLTAPSLLFAASLLFRQLLTVDVRVDVAIPR
jgi:hypothetical protein